jgi:hypothetical protein
MLFAPIASAYRLLIRKTKIMNWKYEIPALDYLLKHKRKLRKLWQCKTKWANCEITPQAIWPLAKSLTNRGEPKKPSAIYGPLGAILSI